MKSVLPVFILLFSFAETYAQNKNNVSPGGDSILITIFLKHQQNKNLDSLTKIEEQNKFLDRFPPKASRVVSWYIMMGIGQVVTVKIPAAELRTLNLSIEQGAWGAFSTEFYPTYDYMPAWKEALEKWNRKTK